ncbi:MAG: type III ribulose-bisphosphate carboxylase [Candidatus Bathyarchaeia archaeon]
MKYRDFVDLSYRPSESDIVCDFLVEPSDMDLDEAAGGVAAESSIGTWTKLTTLRKYVKGLRASVFSMKGSEVRIAYPIELFEPGNMPNILSSLAGNVFGLGSLRNLRLNDIHFPEELVKSFRGPRFGIPGIRRILKVPKRPLVGTIIKPKLGLGTRDHARVAYDAWIGGCDIVKDDENLSSQSFNPFENRVVETLKRRDEAEEVTGERKVYMVNVTAETQEMLRRAQFVADQGGEYIMVDILTCGFSALQTLRNREFDLVIHAHRAGHAAFTRNPRHGVSMKVIAKLVRMIGCDQLHVGTAVGKMSETREEVVDNRDALRKDMYGLRPVLPVASGGIHPVLVPALMEIFGNDFVIQAGGGIHGHPNGTVSGAKAMRQAVDAVMQGHSLEEYANSYRELREALDTWK